MGLGQQWRDACVILHICDRTLTISWPLAIHEQLGNPKFVVVEIKAPGPRSIPENMEIKVTPASSGLRVRKPGRQRRRNVQVLLPVRPPAQYQERQILSWTFMVINGSLVVMRGRMKRRR